MNQPAINTTTTLDDLCAEYLQAKAALKLAQQHTDRAAQRIIEAVGLNDEGSFTVKCDGYKVTTTQPINRSLNKSLVHDLRREIPADIWDAMFEFKPSLNVRLFKECQELRPDVHHAVSKAVTSKPGKPQLKLEELS